VRYISRVITRPEQVSPLSNIDCRSCGPVASVEAASGSFTAAKAEVTSHADACRARIPHFAARHFGWRGTLRLHRRALGFDLLRAPLNVLLVGPALSVRVLAWLCRCLGLLQMAAWLARRDLFVETELSRTIADLILGELLGVTDASRALPADRRERVRDLLAEYVAARHAMAEFAAGFVAIAVGLTLVHALTPSAISLGPLLAREMAQQEAIEGFWLGSWAGAIYHGWFPAMATWPEVVATTLAVMACFAVLATFMGLLTDPMQQLLGLHRRRLEHLVNTFERIALGEPDVALGLPDPYLARVTDLADVVLMAMRLTR
jgi:hypothetical protein